MYDISILILVSWSFSIICILSCVWLQDVFVFLTKVNKDTKGY